MTKASTWLWRFMTGTETSTKKLVTLKWIIPHSISIIHMEYTNKKTSKMAHHFALIDTCSVEDENHSEDLRHQASEPMRNVVRGGHRTSYILQVMAKQSYVVVHSGWDTSLDSFFIHWEKLMQVMKLHWLFRSREPHRGSS